MYLFFKWPGVQWCVCVCIRVLLATLNYLYFLGLQEKEGPDHDLALASVNIENVHAQDQENEKGSPQGHTPVKEEQEKGKKNDRRKVYLPYDPKH